MTGRPAFRRADKKLLLCGLLLASLLAASAGAGEAAAAEAGAPLPQEVLVPPADIEQALDREPAEPGGDPCDQPGSFRDEWVDLVQRAVYFSVCGTVSWFDSLFGTAREYQDSRGTYGRVGVLPYWDRHGGLDPGLRLRGRFALPALEDRLQLMVGRGEGQSMIDGRNEGTRTELPTSFRALARDESWLVGLGYSARHALHNDISIGGGVRVGAPLDPYVNASWRHDVVLGRRSMLRFRETLFWQQSRQFGSTTEVSLDRMVGPNMMARWEGVATFAGAVSGVQWSSRAHLFRSLGQRRAVDFSLLADGETGAEVPLHRYGVEALFRTQVARPWLFLEVRTGLTWPRETLREERRPSPGIGIGIEMYFGPVPPRELN